MITVRLKECTTANIRKGGMIMLRVGMLTSGGDCQALNAAMRGVAKSLFNQCSEVEIYGFTDGYKGLIYGEYRLLKNDDFSGILNIGGTILGSSRMPFKYIGVPLEDGSDKIERMIDTYKKLNLDCLVVLGGNGSHKTANLLREKGLNVLTLPKTIDNDLAETEISFGFQSAVDIATNAIDCIHTTAASHSRVFIVELMGHKTGWLTLHAGIAGGADIILIPEIPYSIEAISQAIAKRTASGKRFTIIAAAEGAISKEEAAMSKKELKLLRKQENYASTAYRIGAAIEEKTGQEVRVTVPGHVQRGGQPVAYDRVLATRLGVKAAELILNHEYGYMVGVKDNKIVKISLCDVAGKTKMVDPDNELITQARQLGICLGE
jgi:6-phosphofructokinase 2